MNCADIAAIIHADMCDDNANGYSWAPRWGGDAGFDKTVWIDGRAYTYPAGSYDCSSSVITAWQLALQYTPYAGALDGATYTGNMRWVFENSGLFYSSYDWAKRGDVYLNDSHHTAMCQDGGDDGVYGYDCLSEFRINEFGDVYNGEVGDQTGAEAGIGAFYEYPWNETLHYNGAADIEPEPQPAPEPQPEPEPEPKEVIKLQTFSAPVNGGDVYRLYNKVTGEHFFTSNPEEKRIVLEDENWQDEGVAWHSAPAQVPVYRLYNSNNGDHMFTADQEEARYLVEEAGWTPEGVNFVGTEGGTPVFRLYNQFATRSNHMFTTNEKEKNELVDAGWKDEGVAFYTA